MISTAGAVQPEFSQDEFVEYEWMGGTYYVPICVEGNIPEDADITNRYIGKYFCRLSMPGYLDCTDCTDWRGPFDTEEEAGQYLNDMYYLGEM